MKYVAVVVTIPTVNAEVLHSLGTPANNETKDGFKAKATARQVACLQV